MASKILIYFVIAIALVGIAAFFSGAGKSGSASNAYINSSVAPSNSSAVLFANTNYAPFSFLISSTNLSGQAQAALSGFALSRDLLQNGTTLITLTYLADGSKQSISLGPQYKLYFIETSFGDDGFGSETSLGDDGVVVVDPNGYVAQ